MTDVRQDLSSDPDFRQLEEIVNTLPAERRERLLYELETGTAVGKNDVLLKTEDDRFVVEGGL